MTQKTTTCPHCQNSFIPAPDAARTKLKTLISDYAEQADGTPRLPAELHADFLRWAISNGAPANFTVQQKWVTNRLLHDHDWKWKNTSQGRRYFPPGDRPYPQREAEQAARYVIAQFQENPAYRRAAPRTELWNRFRDYAAGRLENVDVTDRLLADCLVNDHGWERTRLGRSRLLTPPGVRVPHMKHATEPPPHVREGNQTYYPSQAVRDAVASFSEKIVQHGELPAATVENEFQRWLQVQGIDEPVPLRWVGKWLMSAHSWSKVRRTAGRFYVAPRA